MIIVTGIDCPDAVKDTLKEVSDNYLLDDSYFLFPGFCDVHVHFREPGFSYKETLTSGSRAAAHGGYTAVCTMPNLNPVPDSKENLKVELEAIRKTGLIHIYPYGSITRNEEGQELADLIGMSKDVIAFSDDGKGVQSNELMKQAMLQAKALGKMIVAHCEDNSLLNGGYIHDGEYAKKNGHKGICSKSEYGQIKRDLRLVRETGCAYHVCHISCKESVELIRQAKAEGLDVTCETAPHYLLLNDMQLQESGYFKMNPPIRSKDDQIALLKGLKDGTIDIIATDHAPHSKEEKSKGLKDSSFGISGIEYAFPLLYTGLVKRGFMTLEELLDKICDAPRRRFNIPYDGYSIWNMKQKEVISEDNFLSMSSASPFIGTEVYGINQTTVVDGKVVY